MKWCNEDGNKWADRDGPYTAHDIRNKKTMCMVDVCMSIYEMVDWIGTMMGTSELTEIWATCSTAWHVNKSKPLIYLRIHRRVHVYTWNGGLEGWWGQVSWLRWGLYAVDIWYIYAFVDVCMFIYHYLLISWSIYVRLWGNVQYVKNIWRFLVATFTFLCLQSLSPAKHFSGFSSCYYSSLFIFYEW